MATNRRAFLTSAALGGVAATLPFSSKAFPASGPTPDYDLLDKTIRQPVFKKELFKTPVIIDTVELLRFKDTFLCRVRSKDGAEGISVGNSLQLKSLYPIFVNRVQPFFIGKDARDLEALLEELYVYASNYKLQSLALWVPVATLEFAILDMMGRISGKSIGELIGDIHHKEIAVYQANSERSELLIPLVRKTFGDRMVISADSNGSYDVAEAIRIGKIMQEYNYDFYEEPVPFDWYEETMQVAKALKIPIAGGEQEPSLHNFRWLIANNSLKVLQPDTFYFGGMVRSMKVARMAQVTGKLCTPHITGDGFGYVYMMHFISAVPNAGAYHEFKSLSKELPFQCKTSSLVSENGVVKVPSGPGLGVDIDPDYIKKHTVVRE